MVYVWKAFGSWWELLTLWGLRQGQRVKVDKEAWEQNHLIHLDAIFNEFVQNQPLKGLKRKVWPESGVSSTSSRWHSKREPGGGGVSLGLSIGGSKIKELGQKLLIWCAAAMKCRPLHRNLHPSSLSLLSFDTKRISVACGTGCDDRDDLLYQEGGMSSSERRQRCLPSSHETPTRRPRITSPI